MTTPRRDLTVVLALAGAGAVLLLVSEPAVGLAVVAGTGAATLVGPTGRLVLGLAVLVLGLAVLVLALGRPDVLLGAGGALVALAGAVAAVRARRWPRPRSVQGDGGPAPQRPRTARDTWEALDRGEDPTA